MTGNNEYLDKLRTIGTLTKVGSPYRRVTHTKDATVISTEHWDGRQDATVRPDTVRYGARTHKTGRKKGETAEVIPMKPKEAKNRYG